MGTEPPVPTSMSTAPPGLGVLRRQQVWCPGMWLPGLDTQLSGLRERHGPKLDVATSHQEPAENVSLLTSANQICS